MIFIARTRDRVAGLPVILLAVIIGSLVNLVQGQTPASGTAPRSQQPAREKEELKREIRELREGQEAIRKELQEIKKILLAKEAGSPTRPPEKINIAARP